MTREDTSSNRYVPDDMGPEMPDDPSQRVNWVVSTDDPVEKKRRYDVWAKHYEKDLLENDGYQAPDKALDAMLRFVPQSARILDAGCGTGYVGKLLHEAGYRDLTGGDYAEGMLEVAAQKNVYNALDQIDLTTTLPYDDDSFDCVVTVGIPMIIPGACMKEFARVVKAGGWIVYSSGETQFWKAGFDTVVAELINEGKLDELIEAETYQAFLHVNTEVVFMAQVWEVL